MISVKNLSFTYPRSEKPVLKAISFDVNPNETVAIIGPNGCGKTTLSYCIAGIFPHVLNGNVEGEIIIDDINVTKEPFEKMIGRIGYIFQNPDSQFVTLRVKDELLFGLENLDVPPEESKERFNQIVSTFGLAKLLDLQPQDLSMGQKQTVALASALVMHPKIMIFDEPGSTLDHCGKQNFLRVINNFRGRGFITLLFLHDLTQIKEIADRVIGLKNGMIFFDKPASKISDEDYYSLYDMQKTKSIEHLIELEKINEVETSVNSLSFSYPKASNKTLDNLSFSLRKNEILGIIGDNGSGKTTLLLLMAGLLNPERGGVYFGGKSAHALNFKELSKHVAILFQNPDHQIFLPTIREELSFGLKNLNLSQTEIDKRVQWAREFFEFENLEIDPHSLSFGWKKILCLASTVLMNSEVLLLDEPELGLDLYFRDKFKELLTILHERFKKTIIIASHDTELIKDFTHRVILLEGGKILGDCSNDEIDALLLNYYNKH